MCGWTDWENKFITSPDGNGGLQAVLKSENPFPVLILEYSLDDTLRVDYLDNQITSTIEVKQISTNYAGTAGSLVTEILGTVK